MGIRKIDKSNEAASKVAAADIAKVIETVSREALIIEINSEVFEVIGHLSTVPPLAADDLVLVVLTKNGYVVSGLMRAAGELPSSGIIEKDGKLFLNAKKGIKIETGDACIQLTSKGKINVDGKNIYTISEGRHRLQGATIELN